MVCWVSWSRTQCQTIGGEGGSIVWPLGKRTRCSPPATFMTSTTSTSSFRGLASYVRRTATTHSGPSVHRQQCRLMPAATCNNLYPHHPSTIISDPADMTTLSREYLSLAFSLPLSSSFIRLTLLFLHSPHEISAIPPAHCPQFESVP